MLFLWSFLLIFQEVEEAEEVEEPDVDKAKEELWAVVVFLWFIPLLWTQSDITWWLLWPVDILGLKILSVCGAIIFVHRWCTLRHWNLREPAATVIVAGSNMFCEYF